MSRKIHSDEAGYVAERKNPFTSGKVVIYVAEQQGVDSGSKYAVVCDAHKTIAGATSIPAARIIMKSVEFCEECMKRRQLSANIPRDAIAKCKCGCIIYTDDDHICQDGEYRCNVCM